MFFTLQHGSDCMCAGKCGKIENRSLNIGGLIWPAKCTTNSAKCWVIWVFLQRRHLRWHFGRRKKVIFVMDRNGSQRTPEIFSRPLTVRVSFPSFRRHLEMNPILLRYFVLIIQMSNNHSLQFGAVDTASIDLMQQSGTCWLISSSLLENSSKSWKDKALNCCCKDRKLI